MRPVLDQVPDTAGGACEITQAAELRLRALAPADRLQLARALQRAAPMRGQHHGGYGDGVRSMRGGASDQRVRHDLPDLQLRPLRGLRRAGGRATCPGLWHTRAGCTADAHGQPRRQRRFDPKPKPGTTVADAAGASAWRVRFNWDAHRFPRSSHTVAHSWLQGFTVRPAFADRQPCRLLRCCAGRRRGRAGGSLPSGHWRWLRRRLRGRRFGGLAPRLRRCGQRLSA